MLNFNVPDQKHPENPRFNILQEIVNSLNSDVLENNKPTFNGNFEISQTGDQFELIHTTIKMDEDKKPDIRTTQGDFKKILTLLNLIKRNITNKPLDIFEIINQMNFEKDKNGEEKLKFLDSLDTLELFKRVKDFIGDDIQIKSKIDTEGKFIYSTAFQSKENGEKIETTKIIRDYPDKEFRDLCKKIIISFSQN